ncbi:zinc finger protein 786-like [Pungitius pungitius]|uniref:zinc finger protein 786-like n=1 Tax=Pungitius pungitius TaxID=134920 RepID=UPI002E0E1559
MQTSHCTTEPHHRFTMSVDHNTSQPVHSDQSSDEEEVGAFARPCYSPRRQISATGTTDQILLPDIGAKPADSLVAKACSQKETFPNSFWNNGEAAWNEVISVAQFDTKYWVGETHFDARSVGTERSRPGAEVMRAEVVSVGNQSATLRVRSPPGVPASVSSALPACVPSSPPTSVPAHPSNPVQPPFRCSLCARPFSQRGSLNRHVRSHLGVRPFSCPRCPMTFSRQYRVTEHMRVHQRFVLRSDFRPASSI